MAQSGEHKSEAGTRDSQYGQSRNRPPKTKDENMKMTREQQIKGTKKALANPKTPKQFLPGLKKRLAQLRRGR